MTVHRPKVLLVGPQFPYAAATIDWFRRRQRECAMVSTRREACDLFLAGKYDLILSGTHLPDGSGFGLIELLAGFPVTLFISHPIEDSCIWLPAILRGVECWGSCALKPGEFAKLIEEVIAGNEKIGKEQLDLRQELRSDSLARFHAFVRIGNAKYVTARSAGGGMSSAPGTLRSAGAKNLRRASQEQD